MRRCVRQVVPWLLLSVLAAAGEPTHAISQHSPFAELANQSLRSSRQGHDPARGNSVILLNEGYDALLLRVHLIRNAQRWINVQSYIWVNDECGRLLMYELLQAAKRGVKVRVIVDSLGAEVDPAITAFISTAHPNLQIKHYRPVSGRVQSSPLQKAWEATLYFRDTNQRMHNKLMTFDNAVGITGGRNIQNAYFDFGSAFTFKDRDAAVIGPAVGAMSDSFEKFWAYDRSVVTSELKDVQQVISSGSFPRFASWQDFKFGGWFDELGREADDSGLIQRRFIAKRINANRVEFVADLPGKKKAGLLSIGRDGSDSKAELTERIFSFADVVKKQLVIQSPYLVLDERGKQAFRVLRDRGIQTIISSNSFGAADHIVTYSANYRMRSFYVEELGFEIYEFKPFPGDLHSMVPHYTELEQRVRAANGTRSTQSPSLCIHAKSFVIDDSVAFIGSYNLDPRSGNLNTEVGLIVEDEVVATQLRENIRRDTLPQNSWVIARRQSPLREVNSLFESLSEASPIDLWPVKNTTSFELIKGAEPVPPGHDRFYHNYRDIGNFPGVRGLSDDEILARIMKAFGKATNSLL